MAETVGMDGDWAITGAGGHVGTVLREGLRNRVAHMRLLDVAPVAPEGDAETSALVDIRDVHALTQAVAGAEGIIHLAAIAEEADLHDLLEVNIAGTYNVLEAARRAGVGRVVLASTNHVTGMYPLDVDVDVPVRPDSLYGVTKVATEALGRLYADKFGLKVACLRIGSCLPAPQEPRHRHTWLSHHDTVAAFLAAMRTDISFSVFYAVSANTDGWWDLTAGRAVGYEPHDDAGSHGQLQGLPPYDGLQGGAFTSPDYTLRAQRDGSGG